MDNIFEKQLVTLFGIRFYTPIKKVVGVYIIWIALHFSLLIFGNSWFNIRYYFYPVGNFSFAVFDFEDYDITEFLFYAIFPAICVLVDINLPVKVKNQITAKVKTKSKYFFALVTWTIFNIIYLSLGLFEWCNSIILFFIIVPTLLLYSKNHFKIYNRIIDNKASSKPISLIINFILLIAILLLVLELKNKTSIVSHQQYLLDEVHTDIENKTNDNQELKEDVESKESKIERLKSKIESLEEENQQLQSKVEELENTIEELQ